jgi:branched-subunit amino acid transport protein
VIVLAVTSALTRASGPVAMGGRDLPARLAGVVDLLAPALLTALIVTETLGAERSLEVNASLAGVIAAGLVLLRRRGAILPAIVVAAAVTALLRAVV